MKEKVCEQSEKKRYGTEYEYESKKREGTTTEEVKNEVGKKWRGKPERRK